MSDASRDLGAIGFRPINPEGGGEEGADHDHGDPAENARKITTRVHRG